MCETLFRGRKITFPIVLDDRWNREALLKYMKSVRQEAVYLPSNIEYLAQNNGLRSAKEALDLLVGSDWVNAIQLCIRATLTHVLTAGFRSWFLSCLPISSSSTEVFLLSNS